ncbi:hypothetical protein [Geothrix paludis]|uniref:hypothetical protein n=1 Tax=Geothrix paludis TaxID=2922722 RepID=UPI001FAE70E6|nr:hypothetical protein [Geothrix paludis]
MNFLRALPCLFLAFGLQAQAPGLEAVVRGGGDLTLDGIPYRLELASVASIPARSGLPPLVRLTGRLVPEEAARAFDLELSVLKNGTLYMLRVVRQKSGGYPDSWAATGKTRVRFTRLEDRSGGRLELACSGPLTGVIGRKPRNATWRGSLWAELP